MLKIIEGDLTDIKEGIVFQCVNCQNKIGSGLARSLYEKWPKIKEEYHKFCGSRSPIDLLGDYDIIGVSKNPSISVVNIYGQLNYGNANKTNIRYVDYGALKLAFYSFSEDFYPIKHPIYFPEKFGCGLAGGDIKIVHKIIEHHFPAAILVRYPNKTP